MARDPSDPSDPTKPRKLPRQERAVALVDDILDATERELERLGLDELTTNRVAEVAGVSVGSVYQYFPGKEALVAAVIERKLRRDREALDHVFRSQEALPFPRIVEQFTIACAALFQRQAGLYAALVAIMGEVARDAAVQAMIDEGIAGASARLQRNGVTEALSRHAGFLIMTALVATLRETAKRRPELLADPAFTRELAAMLAGYAERVLETAMPAAD